MLHFAELINNVKSVVYIRLLFVVSTCACDPWSSQPTGRDVSPFSYTCQYGSTKGTLQESEWVNWFILRRFLTAGVLWATDRAPGNETKDERAPDMNTPGFEPGTQWSEVECSTARPSAPRFPAVRKTIPISLLHQSRRGVNVDPNGHVYYYIILSY